jgi:hypothetical protein
MFEKREDVWAKGGGGVTGEFVFPTEYYLEDKSRIRWAWHVARMWERKNRYRVSVGRP